MNDIQANPHKSRQGVRRIFNALRYSIAGLVSAYQHEAAFRQELALAAVLLVVALLVPATASQQALLIACLLIVLITELLNSAIEAIVDRVTLEQDELAKRSKDMGSAAVFLSIVLCAVVWGAVLADIAHFQLSGSAPASVLSLGQHSVSDTKEAIRLT